MNSGSTIMARPKKEINEDTVAKLAEIGCTYKEIADWFQVDISTIRRRFAHVIKEGHTEIKQSIRRKQIEVALNGDRTMLIWLGKQMLGQRENPDDISEPVSKINLKSTDTE